MNDKMASAAFVARNMTPSSRNSFMTPLDHEVGVVDDDISRTVDRMIELAKKGISEQGQDDLQESLSKLLQAERNHWKQRLTNAMQEIDRQHKVIIGNQAALQDLMTMLSIPDKTVSGRPEQILEDEILTSTPSIENMVEHLKLKIHHLKDLAGMVDEPDVNRDTRENKELKYSDLDIRYLKNAIAKIHWEKQAIQSKLDDKEKHIKWLSNELDTAKGNNQKLQNIVAKYNESHQQANFHLEITSDPEPQDSKNSVVSGRRERVYVEGDQLHSYPLSGEETALWKLRLKQQVYSTKKGNSRTGLAQCLRCRKLFKPSDNGCKACLYHSKGREIKEQYDDNGKILNVVYKWACCKRGLESHGCCHGYHI